MKLDLTGIHVDITEGLTEFVERKVSRLGKFFHEDTIIHVTISASNKDKQKLNIRIEQSSHTYIADVETNDVYESMDEAIEIIIGQIRKQKDKKEKQRYDGVVTPNTDLDIENVLEDDEEQ